MRRAGRFPTPRLAAKEPRMRRAGSFQMPRLAAKEPRMRRAGSFQMPRLAAKAPRKRPVTGLRRVLAMIGEATDTRASG
jgi:hypothetical protein